MASKLKHHGWKGTKSARARWFAEQRPLGEKAGRRFRRHVCTPKHPRRRIVRPTICTYCPRRSGEVFDSGYVVAIQAAHIDYTAPFAVLWLCQGCHRKMERGTLRWRAKDIHDYSSLINRREWALGKRNSKYIAANAAPF